MSLMFQLALHSNKRAQKSIEKPAGYENQYCLNTVKSNKAKESSYSVNAAPANTLFCQFNEREKNQDHKLVHKGFMEASAENPKGKKYCLDFQIQDKEKAATTHQGYHQLNCL